MREKERHRRERGRWGRTREGEGEGEGQGGREGEAREGGRGRDREGRRGREGGREGEISAEEIGGAARGSSVPRKQFQAVLLEFRIFHHARGDCAGACQRIGGLYIYIYGHIYIGASGAARGGRDRVLVSDYIYRHMDIDGWMDGCMDGWMDG